MPAKRALLIGINAYPYVRTLDGCVNDVHLMRSVLVDTFGFDEQEVRMIVDAQATREGILAALDALVSCTEADDVVVIHYAGHGSRMTDREGDEPSGFDSTLVPFDSGRAPRENRDITDDEIHLKLQLLTDRTPFTTIVVDSCHSGTITRDAFGAKVRTVEADRRPVSALPPSSLPKARVQRSRSGAGAWMPLADRYVLLAGCADDEQASEYRAPEGLGSFGALTYFLCQELRQPDSSARGTTHRDLFERVAARVTANNRAQHPQMEGKADRVVFGVADLPPVAFVPVSSREDSSVVLGCGAAHGLTVGSTFRVFPQGTKDPAVAKTLGEAQVHTLRPFMAEARITREDPLGQIAPGCRAFELSHAASDSRLAVQLMAPREAQPADDLARMLRQSRRLQLVSESTEAAARIYLLTPRSEHPSMPVPQVGPLDAPCWAVVGGTGELLMRPKKPGEESVVLGNLERLAICRHVLGTANGDPYSRLRGRFSLELLRLQTDRGWCTAEPDATCGQVVFEEGDQIGVRITSQHQSDVFIAVLDIGLAGAITVVCQEKLGPGRAFEIHGPLSFPEGYPFVDLADARRRSKGTETVKLFVTEQFVDFMGLTQSSVRSGPVAARPLGLAALLQGDTGTMTSRSFNPVPTTKEDWTTVSRSFLVRRTAADIPPDGA